MLKNRNSIQEPIILQNQNKGVLNRERGSAPCFEIPQQIQINNQRDHIIDEYYAPVSSSMRGSAKGVSFHQTIQSKINDSRKGKMLKQQKGYTSQVTSPLRHPDANPRNQVFRNSGIKFNAQNIAKVQNQGKAQSLQRRAIKVGATNKKFPKDFF